MVLHGPPTHCDLSFSDLLQELEHIDGPIPFAQARPMSVNVRARECSNIIIEMRYMKMSPNNALDILSYALFVYGELLSSAA
jgi:hypothetical protein